VLKLLKSEGIGLSLIVLLNLFLRLFRLDSPNFAYLDEKNFFLPAIRARLQEVPDFTNEQPQLGKYIIAQSIRLFGDNPWGWRIPSAIFGTLIVVATYFLAKKIFGGKIIPILSSLFITFEFSLFILSRMVMMEVFFAAFALFGLLFVWLYVKTPKSQNIIFSSVFFGFAASVKWTVTLPLALSFFFIVFFTKTSLTKKAFHLALMLLGITLIYITLYLPFITQVGINNWIKVHKKAWYYHTTFLPQNYETYGPYYVPRFRESEIYFKNPLLWLTDPQIIYFDGSIPENKSFSVILLFSNPVIFFGGVVALIYAFFKKIKDLRVLFTCGIFLSAYIPLFFTPPPVTPHYLLFGIPALCLILSFATVDIIKNLRWLIFILLIMSIIVFLFYYPLLTALPVRDGYFHFFTRF